MSDVVRIDSSISFHLSKLSNAKLSILYDIHVYLVRHWKKKLKLITLGSQRIKPVWGYIYHKESNCQTKLVSLIPQLCAKGHPGYMAYTTFQKHERFTSRPLSTQGLLVWWKNLFVFKQYNGDQNWRKQLTRGEEEKPKQLRNILFSCLWYQTLSARVESYLSSRSPRGLYL